MWFATPGQYTLSAVVKEDERALGLILAPAEVTVTVTADKVCAVVKCGCLRAAGPLFSGRRLYLLVLILVVPLCVQGPVSDITFQSSQFVLSGRVECLTKACPSDLTVAVGRSGEKTVDYKLAADNRSVRDGMPPAYTGHVIIVLQHE